MAFKSKRGLGFSKESLGFGTFSCSTVKMIEVGDGLGSCKPHESATDIILTTMKRKQSMLYMLEVMCLTGCVCVCVFN